MREVFAGIRSDVVVSVYVGVWIVWWEGCEMSGFAGGGEDHWEFIVIRQSRQVAGGIPVTY
jgi:hypothetical protein